MLTIPQRTSILALYKEGISKREISSLLNVSRGAIRRVIRSQSTVPEKIKRPQKAEEHLSTIHQLYDECKGNWVRVHEELCKTEEVEISYPTLTALGRRHGIGVKPKRSAGSYSFQPGQEIQHDTSPHYATIGGKRRKIQTAGAVLCHSTMRFAQCYPRFRRFECKVFLTETVKYFQGACVTMMIDNTHVVVLCGTGATMIPVPEMEAFAQRLGFRFQAHAVGHANRSAHVERFFHHFETNFLAGRTFKDWEDLNRQAREWCEKVNASYKLRRSAKRTHFCSGKRTHSQTRRRHRDPNPIRVRSSSICCGSSWRGARSSGFESGRDPTQRQTAYSEASRSPRSQPPRPARRGETQSRSQSGPRGRA
ncbi:MAG: hypothetical protein GY835_08965 [bacterium]|nr:hypothetical protein [bacterium]